MLATDPITLEIIESSVRAASDEMFAALRKTAMSAIISEVLDMGTGITDGEGNLASSGAGIPSFVGVLDKAVKRILELYAAEEIAPGDIFITNDPSFGGVTHLNDVVLALPVFAEAELIAWTANIAHWNDIGGMAPGSVSTDAREIFQEGLRLPAVRLFERGALIRPVLEILLANSRLPDFLRGDMWAGVAAVRIGERRILDLVAKYGRQTFVEALRGSFDHGEQVARSALAELPDGRYALREEQDSGVVYSVALEIAGNELVIDLRDNPEQDDGPNNVSRDGAVIASQIVMMNLVDPHGSANAGHFRPLTVLTQPGSVFDPSPAAACGIYYEVRIRLYDLLWRCFAEQVGVRLPAGGFTSVCGTYVGGRHPDTGRHFTIVEPQVGGWGASPDRDGNNALFSGSAGHTFNCPAEIAEARYGLYVEQLRLNDEPGGEGEFRGGKGIVLDYRVRSDGCFLTCSYTRDRHPPWPLAGGQHGSSNYVEVLRVGGAVERHAVVTGLKVDEGDVIRIHTGNGAGYGDPARRAQTRILDDLRNGYVSEETARLIHGFEAGVSRRVTLAIDASPPSKRHSNRGPRITIRQRTRNPLPRRRSVATADEGVGFCRGRLLLAARANVLQMSNSHALRCFRIGSRCLRIA